jgi:phage terminase large subunit
MRNQAMVGKRKAMAKARGRALKIDTPRVFLPLLEPARYKGAYGGRGSGKSHFFAELLIEDCLCERGLLAVCIREVQKSLKDSSKRLIEAKLAELRLGEGDGFKLYDKEIRTPGDGVILFTGLQDHTAEAIKSLEGFRRAWIEEAQVLSHRSLTLLRPTIRAKDSQIWASWNPRRKGDAVDEFFRAKRPVGAVAVEANWRDNPWFPDVLESERRSDMAMFPERYEHIWEGSYVRALEGAYFAGALAQAKAERRICHLAPDPLLPVRAFFDIGGSGASADAMAIWIAQFVDREIRVLDYMEGAGQVLAYYVNCLRARGWGGALCVLTHDGVAENSVTGKRYEDHVREAGFEVQVIKNQGRGAAMMRIEAARRLFPRIWFNEAATEAGREALGWYHEKKDEARGLGLGPQHDWSSHAADAFGLMCIAYEEPERELKGAQIEHGEGSWMG